MKPWLNGLFVGAPVAVMAYFVNGRVLMDLLPEYGDYPTYLAVSISFLLLAMALDCFRMNAR